MEDQRVRIKYKFPEDYNPLYVNGAYGGPGPRGELVVNFYLERTPVPREETYSVTQDGRLSDNPVSRNPEDLQYQFIRFVQAGIVVNLQDAKRIHDWLGKHIETLEAVANKGK